jgi:hypothetical protein
MKLLYNIFNHPGFLSLFLLLSIIMILMGIRIFNRTKNKLYIILIIWWISHLFNMFNIFNWYLVLLFSFSLGCLWERKLKWYIGVILCMSIILNEYFHPFREITMILDIVLNVLLFFLMIYILVKFKRID